MSASSRSGVTVPTGPDRARSSQSQPTRGRAHHQYRHSAATSPMAASSSPSVKDHSRAAPKLWWSVSASRIQLPVDQFRVRSAGSSCVDASVRKKSR